jgi:hypothetical protein
MDKKRFGRRKRFGPDSQGTNEGTNRPSGVLVIVDDEDYGFKRHTDGLYRQEEA